MTVLNVEYLSELDVLPYWLFAILIFLTLFGFGVGFILLLNFQKGFWYGMSGVLLLLASFCIIGWMYRSSDTETNYISKKYVMFEDDKMPIEEFIDWEIVDFKEPIYILAPRDGKKIKDEEKATNEH